jgi:hypothetical protein
MAKTKSEIVNDKSLGAILNIKGARIRQLVKEGMPRAGRNKYALIECVKFYVRFLQNALEHKGAPMADGSYTLFKEEKSRTMRVTAELKELELAEKRGKLVSVEDATKTLEDFAHMTKARIRAVPPRLAAEVMGQDSLIMCQALIAKRLDEALTQIANDGNTVTQVGTQEVTASVYAKNLA